MFNNVYYSVFYFKFLLVKHRSIVAIIVANLHICLIHYSFSSGSQKTGAYPSMHKWIGPGQDISTSGSSPPDVFVQMCIDIRASGGNMNNIWSAVIIAQDPGSQSCCELIVQTTQFRSS